VVKNGGRVLGAGCRKRSEGAEGEGRKKDCGDCEDDGDCEETEKRRNGETETKALQNPEWEIEGWRIGVIGTVETVRTMGAVRKRGNGEAEKRGNGDKRVANCRMRNWRSE
jgi:hypothetical protein